MGQPMSAVVVLLGLVFAIFVLVALAAAFVVRLHAQWARIAVRVAGSWIAASGLLMLGWAVAHRLSEGFPTESSFRNSTTPGFSLSPRGRFL